MAKENSFDIVSEISMQEVDNALNQARQEAATRYDLKAADCVIEFDKAKQLTLTAANDFALKSLVEIVQSKLFRRGIDTKAVHLNKPEPAAGSHIRQSGEFVQGISTDIGREINKMLKQTKLKIAIQIQGDQVRVTSKSRDDLQEAMRLVKEKDFGIPLQYTNFR